jgi:hypothetical protein
MPTKSNLKFYLTASEPNESQTDLGLSLGGYPSTTELASGALLSSAVSPSSTTISLSTSLTGADYLLLNSEILRVSGSGTSLTVVERHGVGTAAGLHSTGTRAYAVPNPTLFNTSLSPTLKQYRCVAVRNISDTDVFTNLRFYFRSPSRSSAAVVKLAVEEPATDIIISYSTSGGTLSLTDSTLVNEYADGYFAGCALVITDTGSSNLNFVRKIATYDGSTGTFTFTSAFPSSITAGTEYRVENAPSQVIESGTSSPEFDIETATPLNVAASVAGAVGIDVSGVRTNGGDLGPHETVYVWFERQAFNNQTAADLNRVIFTAIYET